MPVMDRLIPSEARKRDCATGYIADNMVSFNIQRKDHPQGDRPITLLPFAGRQRPIVPGLRNDKTDQPLKQTMQETHAWEDANSYGFALKNHFYSFLWRFRRPDQFIRANIRDQYRLDERTNRDIKRKFRNYRNHLRENISPGNVFILPDVEINFQYPSRSPKPYARPVLVLSVYPERLLIVPFSTKFNFLNRETAILFDSDISYHGRRLDLNEQPAIENFPYLRFPKRTFLAVTCCQSVDIHDFLDSALTCLCAVQKDIIDAVWERLKKLGPIRFIYD